MMRLIKRAVCNTCRGVTCVIHGAALATCLLSCKVEGMLFVFFKRVSKRAQEYLACRYRSVRPMRRVRELTINVLYEAI